MSKVKKKEKIPANLQIDRQILMKQFSQYEENKGEQKAYCIDDRSYEWAGFQFVMLSLSLWKTKKDYLWSTGDRRSFSILSWQHSNHLAWQKREFCFLFHCHHRENQCNILHSYETQWMSQIGATVLLTQTSPCRDIFSPSKPLKKMFAVLKYPSNSIIFPSLLSSSFSYPIQLDDDTRLALLVSIVTVLESRACIQNGSVELTGALGVVLHIATVLLLKELVGSALVVFLGLDGVVVSCRGREAQGLLNMWRLMTQLKLCHRAVSYSLMVK